MSELRTSDVRLRSRCGTFRCSRKSFNQMEKSGQSQQWVVVTYMEKQDVLKTDNRKRDPNTEKQWPANEEQQLVVTSAAGLLETVQGAGEGSLDSEATHIKREGSRKPSIAAVV
ncbi:hypothetical protein TRVL_05270 [Trypanosoma vivax]|nr:hypothetical protein TRVL_05270 [Trypanosoma vivax]